MTVRDGNQNSTRRKVLFVIMATLHGAAIFVPLLLVVLGLWEMKKEEHLAINLVEEPSSGPVVDIRTTRLPPSEKPNEKVAPAPVPEQPDIPNPPPVPNVPKQPQIKIPDIPAPPKQPTVKLPHPRPAPRPVKAPKQPSLPRVRPPSKPVKKTPSKPPAKPVDNRKFTPLTSRQVREMTGTKAAPRTGSNFNKDVPIGTRDAAQRYATTFSNTAQGGPDRTNSYGGKLQLFLKTFWRAPSRANLGNRTDLFARVEMNIGGDGRLLSWSILQSSGDPTFDMAVRRMMTEPRQYPATDDGKPIRLTVRLDMED